MNRVAEQVFFSVFFAIHLPPIEEGEFLLCYVKINNNTSSLETFEDQNDYLLG